MPATRSAVPAIVAVVAASVLVAGIVVVVQRPELLGRALPGVADCRVTAGETELDLDAEEATRATSIAARSMRLDLPQRTTQAALRGELDLDDDDAAALAAALKGAEPASLTCLAGGSDSEEPDRLDRRGLTARAAAVRADLLEAFGQQQLGGFAPGGVREGHMPGSAHYSGRAVDVFYRPVTEANQRRGWATAHYLVAHADRLDIDTVIFDGRIWTARRSVQGWRAYEPDTSGRSPEVAAILEHRDHVHVDVAD